MFFSGWFMKVLGNLLLAVSMVATSAYGVESKITSSDENSSTTQGKSAAAREGKKAWVGAELIGLTFFPVSGVRGGYFVNPDLVVQGAYATGEATLGSLKFTKTVAEVGAKQFFGNSFYVDGNLAYENFAIDTEIGTASAKGSVTSTGLSAHIGNQWQWDGFTMGCDWLGYFAALSSEAKMKGSSVADDELEEEEKNASENLGGGSIHLTRFYLGWAF